MPPFEFAGDVSWGYNPAHPFAIESGYGGPDAFKRFIKAAHEIGMAVIVDVVYNHLGPSDLDLWRFDGWHEGPWGGIYFYNDDRAVTPWGNTRPDYGRGEVRAYLRDNALTWLEAFQCDGLRFDSTKHVRAVDGEPSDLESLLPDGWSFMAWITDEIRSSQPWKVIIAEDLALDPTVVAPTEDGGAGFSAQWDAGFVHPVRAALTAADDADRNLEAVVAAITGEDRGPALTRVIYTESHDEVANGKQRVPEEISPGDAGSWWSRKRAAVGSALVLTSPGIPMLFQGQELLEDRWFEDTTPLDWSKADLNDGVLRLHRDLIRPPARRRRRVGRAARRGDRDPASRRRREGVRLPPLGRRAGRATTWSSSSTWRTGTSTRCGSGCPRRAPGASASTATARTTTRASVVTRRSIRTPTAHRSASARTARSCRWARTAW